MTDQTTPAAAVSAAGPATPTDTDPTGLRDRIAAKARTVKLRLGPNAIALAQRGEPIILNMSEADDLAAAVLAVLPAPVDRAAVLREAADWYAQQGKVVLAASQVAADLRRRADAEPRRMADETQQPTNGEESPTEAARRFARRLAAVERLCSGRPGYHTITVKALLTAMSDTDDEAQQDGGEQ